MYFDMQMPGSYYDEEGFEAAAAQMARTNFASLCFNYSQLRWSLFLLCTLSRRLVIKYMAR